jgi:hypothetical protein
MLGAPPPPSTESLSLLPVKKKTSFSPAYHSLTYGHWTERPNSALPMNLKSIDNQLLLSGIHDESLKSKIELMVVLRNLRKMAIIKLDISCFVYGFNETGYLSALCKEWELYTEIILIWHLWLIQKVHVGRWLVIFAGPAARTGSHPKTSTRVCCQKQAMCHLILFRQNQQSFAPIFTRFMSDIIMNANEYVGELVLQWKHYHPIIGQRNDIPVSEDSIVILNSSFRLSLYNFLDIWNVSYK